MTTQTLVIPSSAEPSPTIWGLSPPQLHDRFWAARGVQVVRQGEPSEIVDGAELFLLTEPNILTNFKLSRLVEFLSWIKPDVLYVRLHDDRERGYRERAITDADGGFVRFERIYDAMDCREARVALTPERRLAQLWQKSATATQGWKALRQEVPRGRLSALKLAGRVYDRRSDVEVMQCIRELVRVWKQPDSTIHRARKARESLWFDQSASVADATRLIGPVWIGAGRSVGEKASVVGPRVLWDDPLSRPPIDTLQWHDIEPMISFARPVLPMRRTSLGRASKRIFDILCALIGLLLTLPIYPFVMLAIWLEDGRPFFFVHRRETLRGRQFGCIKFRSMRKDADEIKARLVRENQADGPQFFIENDPRLTRVGRFIRKTYIDELPQLWNVLKGEMSLVGPRPPTPGEVEQYEAWQLRRLEAKPGLTCIWQVSGRSHIAFDEWVRMDVEYVEKQSFWLDLKLLLLTIPAVITGRGAY